MSTNFIKCIRRLDNNRPVFFNPEFIVAFEEDSSGKVTVRTLDGERFIITDTISEFASKFGQGVY